MLSPRVLIVEDDAELRSLLRRALEEEDLEVTLAHDGGEALRLARADPPDVIVLDIGLPDADGRDVCQALRAEGVDRPVLFLTARDGLTDRVSGFTAGGDDYLTKPFHVAELVVRVRALYRRAAGDPRHSVGDLRLDPGAHAAAAGERSVPLTPTEFRILATLAAQPGRVVRRTELIGAAWPTGAIVQSNTLDQYLARVRRKLRELEVDVEIDTAHGIGYTLR